MTDFDGESLVISNPDAFKRKLGIGEDAFASLRRKKNLNKYMDGILAGTFGAGVLFVGTLIPIGWVIAGGVGVGYIYSRIRNRSAGKKKKVDVIPKYINTPMDALADGLLNFWAPLCLKIAFSDKKISTAERELIRDYFIVEWGYSDVFVSRRLRTIEKNLSKFDIEEHTEKLIEFKKKNVDCNFEFMAEELKQFLNRVLHANDIIDDQGLIIVKWIEDRLELEKGIFA